MQEWLPGQRRLARRLSCDSPVAVPGSSPPAGIPSASFAPRCSRDAPPPTDGSQQRQDKRGHNDPRVWQPERGDKEKQWRRHKPKPLPQTQRWISIGLKHNWRESCLKQRVTRRKMENEATKGQNDRRRELLQHCQVWAPAIRAMQLSCGGRTARADSQSTRSPQNTNKRNEWNLLSTGVGSSCDALWDYLPKNGVHVLEFSFHNKVIIIRGGRGAGVRLRGRGRGEGHVETSWHDTTCTLTHRYRIIETRGHLSQRVWASSYLGEGRYPLSQFGLYLRQRLSLPHGLLELLLCEL